MIRITLRGSLKGYNNSIIKALRIVGGEFQLPRPYYMYGEGMGKVNGESEHTIQPGSHLDLVSYVLVVAK